MFRYETTIRLYDTDAAGILFFANQFRFVEEAYEAFLEDNGIQIKEFLNKSDFIVPIVHADSDFLSPLGPGDKIIIEIKLIKMGKTSFTLGHKILKNEDTLCGKGSTVHVCVSSGDFTRITIPDKIKKILESV
ncbi:MAG: thioesterase family protein [Acidobacteriota bacterium]